MFDAGQVIVVTGASSGLGRALALECLSRGATVVACGRDRKRLDEARQESNAPERWNCVVHDFMDGLPCAAQWVGKLARVYGKLWGLAHCAGSGVMNTLGTYDLEEARAHIDLNFHLPILLAKGFADRRVSRKGGAMLFMGSAAAVYPEKGLLLYGAAKSAMICAAKSISRELAPRNIRVHCLSPAYVDTPMSRAAEDFMGTDWKNGQQSAYPLGYGKPADVARMGAFLLSSQAEWITGQNFVLDGGRY